MRKEKPYLWVWWNYLNICSNFRYYHSSLRRPMHSLLGAGVRGRFWNRPSVQRGGRRFKLSRLCPLPRASLGGSLSLSFLAQPQEGCSGARLSSPHRAPDTHYPTPPLADANLPSVATVSQDLAGQALYTLQGQQTGQNGQLPAPTPALLGQAISPPEASVFPAVNWE